MANVMKAGLRAYGLLVAGGVIGFVTAAVCVAASEMNSDRRHGRRR